MGAVFSLQEIGFLTSPSDRICRWSKSHLSYLPKETVNYFHRNTKGSRLKYIPWFICRRYFLFVNSWSRNCLSGRDNLSPLTSHTARQTKIVGTKLHLRKVSKTRGIANNWCNFKSLRLFSSVFNIYWIGAFGKPVPLPASTWESGALEDIEGEGREK